MATWSVTPSEGVEDKGDGKFTFLQNDTYCSREYTVSYVDTEAGCSCKRKVYVPGLACENSVSYGTGTSSPTSVSSCGSQNVTITSNNVPYTATPYTVSDDCLRCEAGTTEYGTVYSQATVHLEKNTGSRYTHTGTEASDSGYNGYISYSITQPGGCQEAKCPVDNCTRMKMTSLSDCDKIIAPYDAIYDVVSHTAGLSVSYDSSPTCSPDSNGTVHLSVTSELFNSKSSKEELGSYSVNVKSSYSDDWYSVTVTIYKNEYP